MEHEDLQLVTGETVQQALGVSRSTLWRLRKNGLPASRVGRSVRYRLLDVRDWLAIETHLPFEAPPVSAGLRSHPSKLEGRFETPLAQLPACHWSEAVAFDPKHRPQIPGSPSTTVRRDWRKYPQEAHILDPRSGKYRRLSADEIAVIQGFPVEWGRELGLSHRERVAGLGNAVPPPVACALFESLAAVIDAPRTAVELCAGFGGLALGAHQAVELEHLALVEFWDAAVRVLRASPHWSSSVVHLADVKKFPWRKLKGQVDVLSGGPPCQPWSSAGLGKGTSDSRDLLGEMPELLRTLEPRAFLFENVPGLLASRNRPYVEHLVQELKKAGDYGVAVGLIQAADYGVPQRRRRVIIAGFLGKPDAVAHRYFDELYNRRSCADPSRPLPDGLGPWVTLDEALPKWRCELGWRRWIQVPEGKRALSEPEVNSQGKPAHEASARVPAMGLLWPGRDRAVVWQGNQWLVTQEADRAAHEIRPLVPTKCDGRSLEDPWYVQGTQLVALDALRFALGRRAKLIYHEAPRLDTDLGAFASEPRRRLDTWLTVAQATLRRILKLLRDDGALVVLAGDAEQPYLQVMLDEMLGQDNRVGTVAWQKGYSVQGQSKDKAKKDIYPTHDYLLIYSRRKEQSLPGVALKAPPKNFGNSDSDPRGPWKAEQKGANYRRESSDFSVNLPPYRWELVGGETPSWFWRISPKSGVIWAPGEEILEAGQWTLRVRVTDRGGSAAEADVVLRVASQGPAPGPAAPAWLIARDDQGQLTQDAAPANMPKPGGRLRIRSKELPTGVVGKDYFACLEAQGGEPFRGTTRPGKSAESGKGRYWDVSYQTLAKAAAHDALDFKSRDDSIPAIKVYLDGASFTFLNQISTWRGDGKGGPKRDPMRVGWGQDAKKELEDLAAAGIVSRVNNISKPTALMARLVALFSDDGDTVVDVGSPAAEMAAVACQLRRRVVYVETAGGEEDREPIRLPRLRLAAQGSHPLPEGLLFFGSTTDAGEDGYFAGKRPKAPDPTAGVSEYAVGEPFATYDRATRLPSVNYTAYPSDSVGFLQALASAEGLVWVPGSDGFFARSLDGATIGVHLSGASVLDSVTLEVLWSRFSGHLANPQAALRIYYHRGFTGTLAGDFRQFELRHIPFELVLSAGAFS